MQFSLGEMSTQGDFVNVALSFYKPQMQQIIYHPKQMNDEISEFQANLSPCLERTEKNNSGKM